MAEIKVEPKRGGLGWLWALIALVVIAAAVWYFMSSSRPAPVPAAPTDSTRKSMIDRPTNVVAEGTSNG
jgi:hypothetical protein